MEKQRPTWVLGVLGLLGSWATAQSGLMLTEVESLDGNQRDLSGPQDVTTVPTGFERVYAAQGRRMAQYVVSTRDRQFVGELTSFATDLDAVEIDEARNLMFVLTGATNTTEPDLAGDPIIIKGKLQVYDVTIPSAPNLLQSINNISGSEIRVIPQDQKLLLIHTVPSPGWLPPPETLPKELWRLTVYNYLGASALTEMPTQHVDLPVNPYMSAATCAGDPMPREIRSLRSAVVQADNAQAPPLRRVFLGVAIKHTRVDPPFQKGTGIIAVKLDPAYSQAPTFYPYIFDGYPCPIPDPFIRPEDYAVRDLDLVKQGSQWLLCTVGGKQHGAKVFLLNSFELVGFDRYVEATIFSGVQDELVAVNVVGNSLAILAANHSIAAETLNLGTWQSTGPCSARARQGTRCS